MANTMTMKMFLESVIAANISDEMTNFATTEIAKINAKNEKKRSTLTATQKENAEIKEVILSLMADNTTYSSPEITKSVNTYYEKSVEDAYSTNKISALMRQLADSNKVTIIKGFKTSKGKVNGYVKNLTEIAEPTENESTENNE